MLEIDGLECIGEVAVFYLPSVKLTCSNYLHKGKLPHELLHQFLIENYNAYTSDTGNMRGYWRKGRNKVCKDLNTQYEVSFGGGEEEVEKFVKFLSGLALILEEDAVYVTMGKKSWLVYPREKNEI